MSECPHKQLKKQMVGEQIWYACECDQKFRVEPWDGRVKVVEGLKVEEGREPDWWTEAAQDVIRRAKTDSSPDWRNAIVGGLLRAYNRGKDVAAQHLKREQEPTPRKWYEYIGKDGRSHWRVTGGNCGCGWTIINDFEWNQHLNREGAERKAQPREQEPAGRVLITKLAKAIHCIIWDNTNHDVSVETLEEEVKANISPWLLAAQPPQELVSLREALQKHRYDYDDIHLRAKCSCGWEYDAAVGRHNGWDWWAIHFEAPLALDFAETEKAIRNLSWDESCNGKWTAVVRVEHVLAILRAALTRGAVGRAAQEPK